MIFAALGEKRKLRVAREVHRAVAACVEGRNKASRERRLAVIGETHGGERPGRVGFGLIDIGARRVDLPVGEGDHHRGAGSERHCGREPEKHMRRRLPPPRGQRPRSYLLRQLERARGETARSGHWRGGGRRSRHAFPMDAARDGHVPHSLFGVVFSRHEPQRGGHRNFRPVRVNGGIERLLQGDRIARDKRQLDLFPIAAREVFEDAPALQPGLSAFLGKNEPVGGFPDRRRDHIAEFGLPLSLSGKRDGNLALVLGAVCGDARKRAVDLGARDWIGKVYGPQVFEDRLHEALRRQERQPVLGRFAAIVGQLYALLADAENAARGGDVSFDFNLRADKRVQEGRLRISAA